MNLKQAQSTAKAALEEYLYTDVCTVIKYQDATDSETKLTSKREIAVLENQPCKLSFESNGSASNTDAATAIAQDIKLFLSPEIKISPGSKIVVTHEGRTGEYNQSGVPAVYPTHQEIALVLFKGWA